MKGYLSWLRLAIILMAASILIKAGYDFAGTGTLRVTSTDKTATITVSQPDHQARIIGVGKAKVRLKPGSYQLAATDNGYQTTFIATVAKNAQTTKSLSLPGAAAISYSIRLFNLLPYQGPNASFLIEKKSQLNSSLSGPTIQVTYADQPAKQQAIDWMNSHGYNPNDYVVNYVAQKINNFHYTEGLPGR